MTEGVLLKQGNGRLRVNLSRVHRDAVGPIEPPLTLKVQDGLGSSWN